MSVSTLLAANGVFVFGGTLFIVVLLIVIAASIFWIWMLIDALVSSMPLGEKVIWVLVIFFLHLLGAIIYFVVRRSAAPRAAP